MLFRRGLLLFLFCVRTFIGYFTLAFIFHLLIILLF